MGFRSHVSHCLHRLESIGPTQPDEMKRTLMEWIEREDIAMRRIAFWCIYRAMFVEME